MKLDSSTLELFYKLGIINILWETRMDRAWKWSEWEGNKRRKIWPTPRFSLHNNVFQRKEEEENHRSFLACASVHSSVDGLKHPLWRKPSWPWLNRVSAHSSREKKVMPAAHTVPHRSSRTTTINQWLWHHRVEYDCKASQSIMGEGGHNWPFVRFEKDEENSDLHYGCD